LILGAGAMRSIGSRHGIGFERVNNSDDTADDVRRYGYSGSERTQNMSLNVESPAPPELEEVDPNEYEDAEVVGETDYKRDEIEALLQDGAWEQAFEDWATRTDVDEREFGIVADLGMLDHFDFFWDSFADRVGYHAPGIPEDWKERELHPELESWETVSEINAALAELGDTVSRTLKADYIDWEADYEAPDDLPDFE
jgi:hypothetical protein